MSAKSHLFLHNMRFRKCKPRTVYSVATQNQISQYMRSLADLLGKYRRGLIRENLREICGKVSVCKFSKSMTSFVTIAYQFRFRICRHRSVSKPLWRGTDREMSANGCCEQDSKSLASISVYLYTNCVTYWLAEQLIASEEGVRSTNGTT